MIERTAYKQLIHSIALRPVTLISGARQVGKTTICLKLRDEKGYGYVSLRDKNERSMARNDPDLFLQLHPAPLIVDEVQYAPMILETIEGIVDRMNEEGINNKGMFVLTGSQVYKLMEGISDSLAGRIAIINLSPLSMSEILGRDEPPFSIDITANIKRSLEAEIGPRKFYERLVRGMYPEPETEPELTTNEFYSDYVDTYINRDVCEIVNVVNKDKFYSFMQLMASLTGQELNYERIASDVGIDGKTVKSWISVLIAGDIIHLLQPYNDSSTSKRIVKRPKMYFWDTGLACFLARVLDTESLIAGYLKGPMTETYMVNEIIKSYRNNRMASPCYYYRDSNGNEVDMVIVKEGKISLIECKSGMEFGWNDIKTIDKGIPSQYPIAGRCILCLALKPYPINDKVYALPITAI